MAQVTVEQVYATLVETAAVQEREWQRGQKTKQERELLQKLLSALEAHPDLAADIKIALRGSI